MFVIVNPKDGTLYRKPGHYSFATYDTLKGARSACTRLLNDKFNKTGRANKWEFVAIEYSEWNRLYNPQVEVKSLMTGKSCFISKSDVGGCCDPSTERYWTM